MSSAAVCTTPRITGRCNPGALTRRHEWEKTIRRRGRPSQRITCTYALAGGQSWIPYGVGVAVCHDEWSSDAGARLIEQSTAYDISCSSVNQLPPADRSDRDPCLSSNGAALLYSVAELTLS